MKNGIALWSICIIATSCLAILATTHQVQASDLGSWTTKASMLTPRLRFAAVAYGGKIYTIGGSDRSGGGTERATSIVEIYDPATNSWTTGTPMPAPKYYTAAAVVGDRIYVMGHDSRLFSYDPALDVWAEHASIPVDADYGFGVGVVDGKIYAVRGSPYYPSGICWTYCYDPSSDTWTSKVPLPFTRSTDSLATLNGKLYAIGGIEPTGGWVHCTRIDVYDPETDSWALDSIARLSVPRTHLEADTPVVNGKIYVIGGWNGYTALSTVEEYNPATNSWRTLVSMPTARYALATAIVNGKIYTLGGDWGGAGGHLQSVNEEYTPPPPPGEPSPPRQLVVEAAPNHDYMPWENVKVRIIALVKYNDTMELVSGANVAIRIYDPQNYLWITDSMTEELEQGIYIWESTETVKEIFLHHRKGVYAVYVEASIDNVQHGSDVVTFHIDPPPEDTNLTPILIGVGIAAVLLIALVAFVIRRRRNP